jgi:hypothetical protein
VKEYPTIEHADRGNGQHCFAFVKYDGSNLRFEWSPKRGWYKSGTRTRLFDATDDVFGEAVVLFYEKVGPEVLAVCRDHLPRKQRLEQVVPFVEFFGPSSFAGVHVPGESKELRLIDLVVNRQGFLDADEFVEWFGALPFAAQVVYEGRLTGDFIRDVKTGLYGVAEGVVCKGGHRHQRWMLKIKTDAYKKHLQEVFYGGWQQFW